MMRESVGGLLEIAAEPVFEGSAIACDDSGSIETDACAVVNAKNVTGSVAISWITRGFGIAADGDDRD